MMAFQRAGSLDQLWQGEMAAVTVGGRRLVLLHLADGVRAYDDRCAHQQVALSGGALVGCRLTCAAHGWVYDVATGRGINPDEARLTRYPVRIEGDEIQVDVDRPERVP
jgi:toluene monooxygenase system ferredoxin subunit